jgi:DNA-binding transcriptional regulator YhcF (GntR family)
MRVRKVRGPVLDTLYARLKRCGNLACTGKHFVEHRNMPVLTIHLADQRPAWQQVGDTLRDAIRSGMLAPGEAPPSVREINTLQGVPTATVQHALTVLAGEDLITLRQGRTAMVAGSAAVSEGPAPRRGQRPRSRDHDCAGAGCKPHVCKAMKTKTIRNIHSILSGAFAAAERWEWIDRNPAESAKPPTVSQGTLAATSP